MVSLHAGEVVLEGVGQLVVLEHPAAGVGEELRVFLRPRRRDFQIGQCGQRRRRERHVTARRAASLAVGVAVAGAANPRDDAVPGALPAARLPLHHPVDLDHARCPRPVVEPHELGCMLVRGNRARVPAPLGHRRPAQPEGLVVQSGVIPRRGEHPDGLALPVAPRGDRLERRFQPAPGEPGFRLQGQVIREQILAALHRDVSQLPHSELVLPLQVLGLADHTVDHLGRDQLDVLLQQRILGPDQRAAPVRLQECVGLLDELHPMQAAVDLVVRPRALRLDPGVVDLVGGDVEVVHAARRLDQVAVHREDQLVGARLAQRAVVVVAVGAQRGELRVFEHVSHVRRRLHVGHHLDEALQPVVDELLQLRGGERPGRADHRVRRVLELVFQLEGDHVHLQPGRPVQVAFQRLHAVLVVLGVPMQKPQLEPGPVLDSTLRQQQPAGRVALGQLQQRLDAVEEARIALAGDLDDGVVDPQPVGLTVGARRHGQPDLLPGAAGAPQPQPVESGVVVEQRAEGDVLVRELAGVHCPGVIQGDVAASQPDSLRCWNDGVAALPEFTGAQRGRAKQNQRGPTHSSTTG